MMGKIWLVICGNAELARVREEISARDARARFLRFDEVAALLDMARAFGDAPVGAAVCQGALEEGALWDALRRLVRSGLAEDVLVFARAAEPAFIARCFEAGATEVIAAGDAAPMHAAGQPSYECMGRELGTPWDASAPAGDDERFRGLEYREELLPWEDELEPGDCEEPAAGARGRAGAEQTPREPAPAEPAPREQPAPARTAAEPAPREPQQDSQQSPPQEPRQVAAKQDAAGAESGEKANRAPLVTVVSGRGGCGKTTLVAAMAACSARAGLRAAVLDFDLMFGNLYTVLGAAGFKGLEGVEAHAEEGVVVESDIESCAMRIGPGLTLWGPCEEPERAELMTSSAEQLIEALRGVADVIFVDTSVHWGDTVAMAVGACERCVLVGSAGTAVVGSTKRVMTLAAKLGVPTTRMTGVFNRLGARGCGEDQAMHFEIGISLRSRARIPDGGDEVSSMLSFGQVDKLVAGSSPFAKAVRSFTYEMLLELGCPVNSWLLDEEQRRSAEADRGRIRLPWRQKAGDAR